MTFRNSLIIHEIRNPCLMIFICKDTLAVLDKFLAAVNFQNYFADKLVQWFVFEAVQNTRSTSGFLSDKGQRSKRYIY